MICFFYIPVYSTETYMHVSLVLSAMGCRLPSEYECFTCKSVRWVIVQVCIYFLLWTAFSSLIRLVSFCICMSSIWDVPPRIIVLDCMIIVFYCLIHTEFYSEVYVAPQNYVFSIYFALIYPLRIRPFIINEHIKCLYFHSSVCFSERMVLCETAFHFVSYWCTCWLWQIVVIDCLFFALPRKFLGPPSKHTKCLFTTLTVLFSVVQL